MKLIPLTQGQTTIVDNEDFDFLDYHRWSAKYDSKLHGYYAVRCFRQLTDEPIGGKGKRPVIAMSRTIMGVTDSKLEVDHINHNTLDNRKENLRVVNHRTNMHNAHPKHKTSKYVGVNWMKSKNAWRAELQVFGKSIHLGLFGTEEDAYSAYCGAVESNLIYLNAKTVDEAEGVINAAYNLGL